MIYAALGLVVLGLLALGLVVVVVIAVEAFKPRAKAPTATPSVSTVFAEPLRRYDPPPTPDLETLNMQYRARRRDEAEREDVRVKLDALNGIAKIVGPEPAPKE